MMLCIGRHQYCVFRSHMYFYVVQIQQDFLFTNTTFMQNFLIQLGFRIAKQGPIKLIPCFLLIWSCMSWSLTDASQTRQKHWTASLRLLLIRGRDLCGLIFLSMAPLLKDFSENPLKPICSVGLLILTHKYQDLPIYTDYAQIMWHLTWFDLCIITY